MMKTSKNGLNLITEFEGCILQSYDDANDRKIDVGETFRGVLTIGYGHTSSAGEPKVFPGMKITKEQAEEILATDLTSVEKDVERLVKVPLNQNQFDALVSFHFNTGALGRSSVLRYLNEGNYSMAAERLLLWNKAKQIGPGPIPGLVRRREAEKKLFLTPIQPQTQEVQMSSLPFPLNVIFSFINPEKIGGWVRAATAAAIGSVATMIVAKIPFLGLYFTPEVISGIAAATGLSLGTVVTGFLSNISKSEKVATLTSPAVEKALDHSRKD